MAVSCPWGHNKGHLGLLQDPAIYLARNGAAFTIPANPLAVYTRKQEKCQVFAADAGVPISDELMVTTRSKHALSSGNMTLGWREWKHLPAIQHTWDNWKIHWMAAFAEMRDISRMTTGKTTFGANQAVEIEQAQQMATSLDNLANASIQKNATIDNLVATNASFSKAIQDIQRTLATMMTNQTPKQGTPTPPGQPTGDQPRPSHWTTVKPPWDRTGYCWSHGYKVKVGHTSSMCTSCKAGLQPGAT